MYLVQDVSWFVWGVMASRSGHLYDVGGAANLWISPLVLWTFEYSQLTQSIILAFNHLQVDLFLFKLLGPIITTLVLLGIIIPLIFVIKSVVNSKQNNFSKNKIK